MNTSSVALFLALSASYLGVAHAEPTDNNAAASFKVAHQPDGDDPAPEKQQTALKNNTQ
ncbi:hypothetical protein [Oceanisphaera avium]|uniref:hypothetical protein n=1 Tax=Oceanisphaera avium TaxID=1903694 RepID=UPI0012FA4F44|nr:hypothetical protein [Oceanisphaera avium]